MKKISANELHKLVESILKEDDIVINEIKRVFGKISNSDDVNVVAEAAINKLLSKPFNTQSCFSEKVLSAFNTHDSYYVRKLAKFITTNNKSVSETMKKMPLSSISKNHRVKSISEKKTSKATEEIPSLQYAQKLVNLDGKKPAELSDQWYKTLAHRLYQDYGNNIEDGWEEQAVKNYVSSSRATNGIVIDGKKLLKHIQDLLNARNEDYLELIPVKISESTKNEDAVVSNSGTERTSDEEEDELVKFQKRTLSDSAYINEVEQIFNIKKADIPRGLYTKLQKVPCVGWLPHKNGFRAIDEQILDKYCKLWNSEQQMIGSPVKMNWNVNPMSEGKISFVHSR